MDNTSNGGLFSSILKVRGSSAIPMNPMGNKLERKLDYFYKPYMTSTQLTELKRTASPTSNHRLGLTSYHEDLILDILNLEKQAKQAKLVSPDGSGNWPHIADLIINEREGVVLEQLVTQLKEKQMKSTLLDNMRQRILKMSGNGGANRKKRVKSPSHKKGTSPTAKSQGDCKAVDFQMKCVPQIQIKDMDTTPRAFNADIPLTFIVSQPDIKIDLSSEVSHSTFSDEEKEQPRRLKSSPMTPLLAEIERLKTTFIRNTTLCNKPLARQVTKVVAQSAVQMSPIAYKKRSTLMHSFAKQSSDSLLMSMPPIGLQEIKETPCETLKRHGTLRMSMGLAANGVIKADRMPFIKRKKAKPGKKVLSSFNLTQDLRQVSQSDASQDMMKQSSHQCSMTQSFSNVHSFVQSQEMHQAPVMKRSAKFRLMSANVSPSKALILTPPDQVIMLPQPSNLKERPKSQYRDNSSRTQTQFRYGTFLQQTYMTNQEAPVNQARKIRPQTANPVNKSQVQIASFINSGITTQVSSPQGTNLDKQVQALKQKRRKRKGRGMSNGFSQTAESKTKQLKSDWQNLVVKMAFTKL